MCDVSFKSNLDKHPRIVKVFFFLLLLQCFTLNIIVNILAHVLMQYFLLSFVTILVICPSDNKIMMNLARAY